MFRLGVFIALTFFILSAGSVYAVCALGRRYEEALPFTCTGIVALLFVFGVCGQLLWGVYAVFGLVSAIYIYSLWKYIRSRENRADILHRLFTPGTLIFIIMLALLIYINVGRRPCKSDELTHWADMVKGMLQVDDFGTNADSNVFWPSYPPEMPLLQYFFEKLYSIMNVKQGFCDWLLYLVYQINMISFFFPFFSKLRLKHPIVAIVFPLMAFLAPNLLYDSYRLLFIDPFLAVLMGCGLAMVFSCSHDDLYIDAYVFCTCFALVLSKAVGLLFAASLCVVYIIKILCFSSRSHRVSVPKRIAAILASVALPYLLWKVERTTSGINQSFSGKDGRVDFAMIWRLVFHREQDWQQSVHDLYYQRIFTYKQSMFGISLPIWIVALAVFILLIIIVWQYGKHFPDKPAVHKMIIPSALAVSTLFFVGLCYSYIFKFSQYEAVVLASLSRYTNIMYSAIWIMCVLLLGNLALSTSASGVFTGLLVLVLVATPPELVLNVSYDLQRIPVEDSQNQYVYSNAIVEKINTVTSELGLGKVYLVYVEIPSDDASLYQIRLNIRPNTICDFSECVFKNSNAENTTALTPAEWKQSLLDEYDYVALCRVDDAFAETYGSLFDENSPIESGGVYKLDKESGMLVLCE